ncbi:hypothetical protein PsorP6_017963 [Peronosclerospora sorghi]|uniref:Uncharacterized protein n=1 Tax=Peronosclerospora sorghi TaxID=230839 RepID=A0ACC0WDC9_9STRA|nr:hypothetical protein PsorP6_017963 [Peronosclerospora sorghi]
MLALGIVLYILLCGSHPFDPYNNLTDEEIRTRILKGRFHTQSYLAICTGFDSKAARNLPRQATKRRTVTSAPVVAQTIPS